MSSFPLPYRAEMHSVLVFFFYFSFRNSEANMRRVFLSYLVLLFLLFFLYVRRWGIIILLGRGGSPGSEQSTRLLLSYNPTGSLVFLIHFFPSFMLSLVLRVLNRLWYWAYLESLVEFHFMDDRSFANGRRRTLPNIPNHLSDFLGERLAAGLFDGLRSLSLWYVVTPMMVFIS